MKTIKTLFSIAVIAIASQTWAQETTSESLIIYSNLGKVEIKNKDSCRQIRNSDGSISISCNNQCTQGIDKTDGKILISGGLFTEYDGVPTGYIVRLNSDGSHDITVCLPSINFSFPD